MAFNFTSFAQSSCAGITTGAFTTTPNGANDYYGIYVTLDRVYDQDVTVNVNFYPEGRPYVNGTSVTVPAGELTVETAQNFAVPTGTAVFTEITNVSPSSVTANGVTYSTQAFAGGCEADNLLQDFINDSNVGTMIDNQITFAKVVYDAGIRQIEIVDTLLNDLIAGNSMNNYINTYGTQFVSQIQNYVADSTRRNAFKSLYGARILNLSSAQVDYVFEHYMEYFYLNVKLNYFNNASNCNEYRISIKYCNRSYVRNMVVCGIAALGGGWPTVVCTIAATAELIDCHEEAEEHNPGCR